jgi:lipopolysaccharide exporter
MIPVLLRWLFREGGRLRDRVVRGAIWQALGSGTVQVLGIIKILILARLLSPSDFGIFSMAVIVLHWAAQFTYPGFNAALIHQRHDIGPYLSTAWTIQILRTTALATTAYLAAPLVAWFFATPELTPVLRALAVVPILRGLINPAVVYLRKELDLRRIAVWDFAVAASGLVVAIPLAIIIGNVWALVLSTIAAHAIGTLMSYWVKPYRPRLSLDFTRALEMMRFGKWVFASHITTFLTSKLDSIIVGKMLGASLLGFYHMGQQVALLPATHASTQLGGLMFPAFTKLNSPGAKRRALLLTLELASVVALPLGFFLMAFAEPLVHLVLGPRWIPVAPCLPLLAVAAIATVLISVTGSLLLAAGRPDLQLYGSLVRIGLLASLLYPLVAAWGIVGAAAAVAASCAAALITQAIIAARLLDQPAGALLWTLRMGVLASVPFVITGTVSSSITPSFVFLLVASIGVYMATVFHVVRAHFVAQP